MTWMVIGGAGYIGGHIIRAFQSAGTGAVVYDDLSTGLVRRVPTRVPSINASVLDTQSLVAALLNVGRGVGVTVKEVMDVVADVTGHSFVYKVCPRRAGDPAQVGGEVGRIADELGGSAQLDLHDMVHSAWTVWNNLPDQQTVTAA